MRNEDNLEFVRGLFDMWCYTYDVDYIHMERSGNGVVFKIGDTNTLPYVSSPVIDLSSYDRRDIVKYTHKCLANLIKTYECEQDKHSLEFMMSKK